MKILLILLIFINTIIAKDIKPTFIIKSKGFVNDFVIDGSKLYVANDEGSVEVFDLKTKKLIDEIFIDPIYTTKQVWQNARILSVDRFEGNTLIVSNTTNAYRNIWIHDGKNLKHIIKQKDRIAIKEARFLTKDKLLFGTLGYEMMVYNSVDSYNTYETQVEQSSFADLVLSEDKKTMATSSESGQVTISNTATGQLIRKLKPLNLDKVYQVAYKNGVIITAGQDRKVAVYPINKEPYTIKSSFLVYSVGLSTNGKTGIYSSDEHSTLQLFDTQTGKKTHQLIGHYAIPTTIKFYDNKSLFSAGYENKIFYWRID